MKNTKYLDEYYEATKEEARAYEKELKDLHNEAEDLLKKLIELAINDGTSEMKAIAYSLKGIETRVTDISCRLNSIKKRMLLLAIKGAAEDVLEKVGEEEK